VCQVRPRRRLTAERFRGSLVLNHRLGAFTPGCQAFHLPPYIAKIDELKSKGVDLVAFIASNDAWVMNAWGKINQANGKDVLLLSDTKTFFSKNYGWSAGMGDRNGRWAMVIDNGKITYAEVDSSPGTVEASSADTVLSKL
jgi:alkyl hydroperoxide reductase 1